MSNIQITENGPGKYSPEWFYSESQTPEWISFAHKADDLRENFINLFGIERLKSLSGKDLLTSLFYNDEGTKTNLCYRLEMDKDIREVFGSISGGAAYKFGLFYHKKNQIISIARSSIYSFIQTPCIVRFLQSMQGHFDVCLC